MTDSKSAPKKEVVYVDIEDDITSIIDKVKKSHVPIVALVPPKRIGALQSVVNLKLLQRAAEASKKRLVMITSDASLTALAAGVAMPVAKNLQSKPELPEMTALSTDDDEVIDGETVPDKSETDDSDVPVREPIATAAPAATTSPVVPRRKKDVTIPNFDAFRNRAGLIAGAAALLVVFLVWAIFFAPHATVTINARTTPYGVNKKISVAPSADKLPDGGDNIVGMQKEIRKTASADTPATGKKEVGEKATGTVKIQTDAATILMTGLTVPAGTTISSTSGKTYTTNTAASFAKGDPGALAGVSVGVTATAGGTSFNGATGAATTGADGVSSVTFTTATTGGTDKTITVVSEQDAASARDKLKSQDPGSVKAELKKQFGGDVIVVDESFTTDQGDPKVSPAIGDEATTAKVSAETVYTMIALPRKDVQNMLEADLKKQIGGLPNQTIYDRGLGGVTFSGLSKADNVYTMTLQTTGYVGPTINATELAQKINGKREGEIQQLIKTYEGIRSVDVKFSPFWVSTAPGPAKTTIKFQVDNAKNQ